MTGEQSAGGDQQQCVGWVDRQRVWWKGKQQGEHEARWLWGKGAGGALLHKGLLSEGGQG